MCYYYCMLSLYDNIIKEKYTLKMYNADNTMTIQTSKIYSKKR